jgi:Asp-tRNA(Asn)/Glu-tRNA(Gln) amidotransferase A subunit family amidase
MLDVSRKALMPVPGDESLQRRRRFLACFAGLGLSHTLLPGVLWAKADEKKTRITKAILREAEKVAGVTLTDAQRDLILDGVNENLDCINALRKVPLDNGLPPALRFSPILPGMKFDTIVAPPRWREVKNLPKPARVEDVAFWPVAHLARLVESRQVTSVALTEMYLGRLKRIGPKLHCVVNLMAESALKQAKRADREIAAGQYRGPLHGIPWGAKDTLATKDARTTWGSKAFKDQQLPHDATVVRKLDYAGAVLVAKLSTGELAYSDEWFGGKTRNPWNPEEGSDGSSAGSAAAVAAGLVGFALGTEAGGSLVCPAARCGVTTLRPTFGRVSRHGVMTTAWSWDKVGALGRGVEDCAMVLHAIRGPDDRDPTVVDLPFNWDAARDVRKLRVGYLKAAFEEEWPDQEEKALAEKALAELARLGVKLVPVELPTKYPIAEAALFSWFAEIGAAWDEFFSTGKDAQMLEGARKMVGGPAWQGRFVPATDAVQANRVRTRIMEAMAELMTKVNAYVAPASRNDPWPPLAWLNVLLTNLTGHPAVVVPCGFTKKGVPTAINFVGRLYAEADLMALAKAYQDATDHHQKQPGLR